VARVRSITGERVRPLQQGLLALTPPGACATPAEAARLTDWIAAQVPGTVAGALEAAGRWSRDAPTPLNDRDAWFRLDLPGAGRRRLRFGGLATICEVWVDHRLVLTSESMFQPQEVEVDGAVLWLCFRALDPRLAAKGPRARWRPFMIDNQGLRLVRTTLLGHMPGWCPPIDIVGPWRAIELVEPGPVAVRRCDLRTWWDGAARLRLSLDTTASGPAVLRCGPVEQPLSDAELTLPGLEPWRPHTHGGQPLYPLTVGIGDTTIDLGQVGFRDPEPVFARGANWITPDLVTPVSDYEPYLRKLVDAGMNMVRVSGVGLYETSAFFEACDRLGLLVWQDFMFANFDYPKDPAFVEAVRGEARALLSATQGSPSLAVLCGGSEVMQQAAMMGLPADLAWPLFDEVLPAVCAELRPDAAYVRNSPSGGPLPFVADQGVTHYYGVGAYERPLEDARRAEVKFAAECLAFANVPQVHDLARNPGVPRDRGASWDFEDTRNHYLGRLYGHDPVRLRREDPGLYLDLSRAVTGEVMAAVFSEWRRAASRCNGGLVWTLHDLEPGAGWGLVDAAGTPKPCWWMLRRVLQPRQVLITDEGVGGLALHVINETAEPLEAELRFAVFGEEPGAIVDVSRPVALSPRSNRALSAFELMGRFFDLTYAYRFGPRTHAACVAQLRVDGAVVSEAIYFVPETGVATGGEVKVELAGEDLVLTSDRLQRFVHIADPAFQPSDDWLPLAPGEPRTVRLRRRDGAAQDARPGGEILGPGGRVLGGY
jgi:beta-mannosidase